MMEQIQYGGDPEHKRHPGDFGLMPPIAWRAGKSCCDDVGIVTRASALALLKEGFSRGLVSEQFRNG